jgi:hypothetical protein
LLLQFVLGTVYFVVLVTVLALFLTCFAVPVAQLVFALPVVTVNSTRYYLPVFTLPLFPLVGIVLWTQMMHLVRWVGGLHGRYAKAQLVTE